MTAARNKVVSLESEIKPINDLIEKIKSKLHSLQSSQADVVSLYLLNYKIIYN